MTKAKAKPAPKTVTMRCECSIPPLEEVVEEWEVKDWLGLHADCVVFVDGQKPK